MVDVPAWPRRIRAAMKNGHWRIRLLMVGVAGLGSTGGWWLTGQPRQVGFGPEVRWWWLAIGFYAAEILVVHLQFRKDAHTFSMSEIPMTVGLLLATPGALLVGQLVGSAIVLAVHRRQRPVKLVFNLGQLAVQTTVAVAVLSITTGGLVAFDERTVAGLLVATLAALFVGHSAVLAAIRTTGGTESWSETARVLAVSSAGTVAATLLGVGASITLVLAPTLWWVGLIPVGLVFVAYRAYIGQVHDKGRVEALFDAATILHRTPQIDRAVEAVARRVLTLVNAESAAVVLFPTRDDPVAYLTVVDTAGRVDRMVPRSTWTDFDLWAVSTSARRRIVSESEAATLAKLIGTDGIRQAVVDVLIVGGEPVGVLAGINRPGDVSAFGEADLRVLATLGSQLSTTLENSRLSETLTELRSLKEQLEALIESKDQLVASVSHELRTPLTGVIGLASVIRDSVQDGRLDPEMVGMLDLVVEQGNELANIIEDLLTHARAEAGTLTLRPQRFDLATEMVTVAASHQLDPPQTSGPVDAFADPLRTRQIVRNLITNARRYGGPTIRLELASTSDNVSVAVVDDGPGVPPSEAAHIFEPYRSAHDQSGQPGSIGLGLAVSRSMAHMMGGDLTYTHRDRHTRFTLTLPTSTTRPKARTVDGR
jgi:signal transduction histidine kinase